MNKLGIFTNFWETNWNFDHMKYVKKARKIGFDILEFQAQPLLEMTKEHMRDIRKMADDEGIELTYSLGLDPNYDVSSADEQIRKSGIDYLKRIVECVGFMDGRIISGVSYAGWGSPDYIVNDKTSIVELSLDSMRQIVKTAEDYGVIYCVEAVNRFEGCVINTAEEALDYVSKIDSENIAILLDTYHMNIEEDCIGDAIRSVGNRLGSFHTGDNNRRCPGRGHINFDEVFQALSDIGYKGRIVSEPFVQMGGEVGRDIKVWRNLDPPDEACLDQEAAYLLKYEQDMLRKYGME
ncbi:D-psicose 3-epimerase [Diplocloster modestus]|uniref:Sugar phosphate isomerase/epimerase n=1 Tax=Diplocloster modestus TaxID=2850322 RepID=A0ABS6K241_9FIRM|nr:sugar phosphate isomerase/epimerase [Diplocloster modestus]MBU9724672.1 sugar phosphate isomerase/epimerase [Diplocloster modestus]